MAGISAWRVNDVVAYDAMRESATALAAVLARTSAGEGQGDELRRLQQDVHGVDAYDRAVVASLATRINDRMTELKGSHW